MWFLMTLLATAGFLLVEPKLTVLVAVIAGLFWALTWVVRKKSGHSHATLWVVLPAAYIALMGIFGVAFYASLANDLGRVEMDPTYRAVTYVVALCGVLLAVAALPSKPLSTVSGSDSATSFESEPALRWLWIIATGIGLLGASRMLSGISFDVLVDDPLSSRREIGAAASSPYEWLAFRFLIVAAAAGTAWVCRYSNKVGRSLTSVIVVVNIPYVLALAAYGGRMMPLMVILDALIVYWVLVRRPPLVKLLIGGVIGYVFIVWYAAYRYFSYFGSSVSWKRFQITFLTQSAGEFSDAQRVSDAYAGESGPMREVLVGQFMDSLPDSLLSIFSIPSYRGAPTFGGFASRTLEEQDIGGIRVGTVGEVDLSFGLVGVFILGLLIGLAIWLALKWLSQGRVVLAAVLTTQMTAAAILGFASLIGVVSLVAFAYLAAAFLRRNPRYRSKAGRETKAEHGLESVGV